MWCNLFQQEEQTPLQKIMVTFNAGNPKTKQNKELITKKQFCQNLDNSCNNIDIQCGNIHDVQETLKFVVRNLRRDQVNNKIKIPTAMIMNIDNVSRAINIINENLSKINNDIQQTRQQYVPPTPPVESPIYPTKGPSRKRKRETKMKNTTQTEISEQIHTGKQKIIQHQNHR
jgi:hypothetical protein